MKEEYFYNIHTGREYLIACDGVVRYGNVTVTFWRDWFVGVTR